MIKPFEYKIGEHVIYKGRKVVVRGIQRRDYGLSNLLTLEIPEKDPMKTRIVVVGVENVTPMEKAT